MIQQPEYSAAFPKHDADLSITADQVVRSLEGQGIVVMRDARADMDRVLRIELQHSPGREAELVRAATALGARIACLEAKPYLRSHYDEAVAEASKVVDTATRESRLASLRRFEPYIGHMCQFEVQAIASNGGMAIVYRATADWHDESAFASPVEEDSLGFYPDRHLLSI